MGKGGSGRGRKEENKQRILEKGARGRCRCFERGEEKDQNKEQERTDEISYFHKTRIASQKKGYD